MKPRLLLALLALVALAGCAAGPAPASSSSAAPRVRCLADPTERDTRPLFFLFCVQSP